MGGQNGGGDLFSYWKEYCFLRALTGTGKLSHKCLYRKILEWFKSVISLDPFKAMNIYTSWSTVLVNLSFFFFFFPQYLAHMSLSWKEKKGGKNSRCWTRKPWWWNQPFDYLLILIHKTALQVASGGLNANLALPVDKKCSQMSFVTGFPMGINGLQEELFLSSRERYSSPDSKLYHRKLFDKCFIIWFPQICSTRLVGTQSDLLQQASMVTLRTLVFRKVIDLKKDKMLVEY